MSEGYYKGENSFSSQFRPSGYTDFNSNSNSSSFDSSSYNYESDNFYNKYDDYSDFSNSQQNKSGYQTNAPQQSAYHTAPSYQFDGKYENDRKYQDLMTSYDNKDSQFTNINSQQPLSSTPQSNPSQITKPLQNYTIRDVLDLPIQRQEYLKSLPVQQLKLQPQYQVVLEKSNVVLGIADYYEKIIPDPQFNSKVKSTKRGKDIKQIFWISSMFGYLCLTGKLGGLSTPYKKTFKGNAHYMIPIALVGLMLLQNKRTTRNINQLIYDKKNQNYVSMSIRKFICESTRIQRIEVFGQS